MSNLDFTNGSHEYKIDAVPLADGNWTFVIVDVDHSRFPPIEVRIDGDASNTTEEAAVQSGRFVAARMAQWRTSNGH